jgi:hypothetical protein
VGGEYDGAALFALRTGSHSKKTAMTLPPSETRRYPTRLILAAAAACVACLAIGWYAAEWTIATRRLALPDKLREGMDRWQVESILRAPDEGDRVESESGDVVVEYIIEYDGIAYPYGGYLIYVRYDGKSKKMKNVFSSRTGEFSK